MAESENFVSELPLEKELSREDSLVVQWLTLSRFQSGDLSLIPGQGTWFYMPQLKRLHAAMKTEDPACCS